MKQLFFVGTYTEPILFGTGEIFHGKGEGVYLCSFDGREIQRLAVIPAINPSYVCVDEERRRLYAVNELKAWKGEFGGGITQWSFDEQWHFHLDRAYPTGGTDPCHIALSPDGRWLSVANFFSGALTVYPVDAHGDVQPMHRCFQHKGHSVHPQRQTGPHAHSTIFAPDGRLFVPDLGLDRLVCYHETADEIVPWPADDVSVAPGSGPRYGEFSADSSNFYLINEIGSSITHYAYTNGKMVPGETVSTLPHDFVGDNICADLHLTSDARFLYASNRGHDSITAFRIAEGGSMEKLGVFPCGGRTPRNFAIAPSGDRLLVGNQDSDCITVFSIDANGMLEQINSIDFPSPVCIRFMTPRQK